MKILFVSHEVAPFAKVGGLADVIGTLPKSLAERGHDVRILMPAYRMVLEDPQWAAKQVVEPHSVSINPVWSAEASAFQTKLGEVPVYLLRVGEWFDHTVSSETVYLPGEDQHIAFARATLDFMRKIHWVPDVVHTHDWHTGLIPVLLKETKGWEGVASVHTIHNLAYQGVFGRDIVGKAGLPDELFDMHRLETWGGFNFLKSACVYADRVNTVSPTYAKEIQTIEFGCTLDGVMRHLASHGRLSGILNGIDMEEFDPARDPGIPANYSLDEPEGKSVCREALLNEMGWTDAAEIPVAGIVTRLSQQKGFDWLLDAAPRLFELPLRIVVQGLGEDWISSSLEALERERPDRIRFFRKFDVDLAQRIYSGSDLFLMPSAFEPCGLGQLIAMRYGTVPIVRRTGGLADTMFEGENGFVFEEGSADALVAAAERAVEAFSERARFDDVRANGLRRDSSWNASAVEYEALYQAAAADLLAKFAP